VFLLGRRKAEGIVLMFAFEELILIGIFCLVILENKVNSLIVTFLIAGKLYFPTKKL